MDKAQLDTQEQKIVEALAARDREVRSHERAHQSAGGALTGAVSYAYQRGPDGNLYAVGGEVGVQIPAPTGDHQRDIEMAQQVISAALAPAQPSAQDRSVAQAAQQVVNEARAAMLADDGDGSETSGPAERVEEEGTAAAAVADDADPGAREGAAVSEAAGTGPLAGQESPLARSEALEERLGEYFETIEQQDSVRSERFAQYRESMDELHQRLQEFNQKLVDIGVLNPDYVPGSVINDQA